MTTQFSALSRTPSTVSYGTFGDFCILTARLLIGLIFLQSGWSKLLNYSDTVTGLTHRGVPDVLAYLAPPVEFFSGLAVILGLFTLPAAILMLLFTIPRLGSRTDFGNTQIRHSIGCRAPIFGKTFQ